MAISHVVVRVSCDDGDLAMALVGNGNGWQWQWLAMAMVGNGNGWQWQWLAMAMANPWPSQVIWISIYSPHSSHRKYRLFLKQKALLHTW